MKVIQFLNVVFSSRVCTVNVEEKHGRRHKSKTYGSEKKKRDPKYVKHEIFRTISQKRVLKMNSDVICSNECLKTRTASPASRQIIF